MMVPQKSRYALRAVLELAVHHGAGPIRVADIAEAQAIPPRFLEAILGQLRQGGIVVSHRGAHGGYTLAREPRDVTVGDVMTFMQGPVQPVECVTDNPSEKCPLYGSCVFLPMWERIRAAISDIYESTTFEDLAATARRIKPEPVLEYVI